MIFKSEETGSSLSFPPCYHKLKIFCSTEIIRVLWGSSNICKLSSYRKATGDEHKLSRSLFSSTLLSFSASSSLQSLDEYSPFFRTKLLRVSFRSYGGRSIKKPQLSLHYLPLGFIFNCCPYLTVVSLCYVCIVEIFLIHNDIPSGNFVIT